MGIYSNQLFAGLIQNLLSSGAWKKKKQHKKKETPSDMSKQDQQNKGSKRKD